MRRLTDHPLGIAEMLSALRAAFAKRGYTW
jgi:hypothetical protein